MTEDNPKSSTENLRNTFFAKAIENWLTNTNELGYQLPFCQLLLNEGFRTVHISKHNPFEQGKDIIAVDADGMPHVYQLKGGNISLTEWRNIVKAEVEELIDLSIVHPSVNKDEPFIPYLVTNGYLEDTVRVQIDNLNENKWKHNPLRVILLGELLEKFLKWSYEFTPQEISNYKTFLELYFSDGRELPDDIAFANFVESVLRLNESKLPKQERKRNIAAAVLLSSYVVTPFKDAKNHVSLIQGLVMLASYILCVAEKFQLEKSYWKSSFDLVWGEVTASCLDLQREIQEGGFEKLFDTLWDGELAPYRKHIAVSYLFAFKLTELLNNDRQRTDPLPTEFFQSLIKEFRVWGEAALLGVIFGYLYGRALAKHEDESPHTLLILCLEILLHFNGPKSTFGLPSPYYSIETGILINLGMLEDEETREDFVGRSFVLEPILELLARAERRDILEKHWRSITYIQFEKFIPASPWMYFLRHCDEGEHVSEFPYQTQSWRELRERASGPYGDNIPETLRELRYFLPLYLLVYPHRANLNLIRLLDRSLVPNTR
jgi:hypothetical protein